MFLCSFLLPYRTREPISALNLICLWVPDSLANLFLIWDTEKASNYLYHLQLQSKPQARPLFLLPVAGKCCFVFLNKMSWVRSYHRHTPERLFSRKGLQVFWLVLLLGSHFASCAGVPVSVTSLLQLLFFSLSLPQPDKQSSNCISVLYRCFFFSFFHF